MHAGNAQIAGQMKWKLYEIFFDDFFSIDTFVIHELLKVTVDTLSVEEDKISLSAFQQCQHCQGSITEAFLEVALASTFPRILNSFKVLPLFPFVTAFSHDYFH
jgi:hypothetical protein